MRILSDLEAVNSSSVDKQNAKISKTIYLRNLMYQKRRKMFCFTFLLYFSIFQFNILRKSIAIMILDAL